MTHKKPENTVLIEKLLHWFWQVIEMTDTYPPIVVQMDKKILPNPYEIQQTDVGRLLDLHDFGKVLQADVGKRVYLRKGMIQMENAEQWLKRTTKEELK